MGVHYLNIIQIQLFKCQCRISKIYGCFFLKSFEILQHYYRCASGTFSARLPFSNALAFSRSNLKKGTPTFQLQHILVENTIFTSPLDALRIIKLLFLFHSW